MLTGCSTSSVFPLSVSLCFTVIHSSSLSFCLFTDLAVGLRNVNVHIPSAVKRGDNALLICNYDIENDTLYAVKWYRGRREFYRYTPKEKPAWKIFTKTNEIDVVVSLSTSLSSTQNPHHEVP